MQLVEKDAFVKAVSYMFSLYPSHQVLEITFDAYWHHLRDLPYGAVRLGIDTAIASSKTFPPTAPQIREVAEVEAKAMAARANDPPRIDVQRRIEAPNYENVPRDPDAQKRYVADAPDEFEARARLMECMAVSLGVRPGEPFPEKLAKKWAAEFSSLASEIAEAKNV